MAIRNFWMSADIDGRKTGLRGGPRGAKEGMTIRLYQRKCGDISNALRIECCEWDGVLITEVFDKFDNKIYTNKTER